MLSQAVLSLEEVSRLETIMRRELRGSIDDLHLDLRQDGLVLSGKARSYYAKQLAQSYVMNAARLNVSSNLITVMR